MTENDFFDSIPEWIGKPKDTWNHITLLAYFCSKYQLATGVQFKLVRAKKGPTMGKEARDFSRLFLLMAPENYKDLKSADKKAIKTATNKKIYNYINWVFDFKLRRCDKSVTGTKFFHIPAVINEFEQMYSTYLRSKQVKTRIDEIKEWIQVEAPEILNDHQLDSSKDFRMLGKYIEMYGLNRTDTESVVYNKAIDMGVI